MNIYEKAPDCGVPLAKYLVKVGTKNWKLMYIGLDWIKKNKRENGERDRESWEFLRFKLWDLIFSLIVSLSALEYRGGW